MDTNEQCQFVNYWMHNGFVRVDDEKMSKSLGNFFTIREVLKKYDAEVVRFFILRAHYRSPLNYSDVHLDDARQALTRLYTALKGVAGQRRGRLERGRMRCASRRRWTTISARRKPWPCCSTWPPRPIAATQALARS
jgi:cysteinyl-tRNA synthetase